MSPKELVLNIARPSSACGRGAVLLLIAAALIFTGLVAPASGSMIPAAAAAGSDVIAPATVGEITANANVVLEAAGSTPRNALSSEASGDSLAGQPIANDDVQLDSVWKLRPYGTDTYALESATVHSGYRYLNVTVADGEPALGLGGRQALTLEVTRESPLRASLSAEVGGTLYYVAFDGGAWTVSTDSGATELTPHIYLPTQYTSTRLVPATDVVAGNEYLLFLSAIRAESNGNYAKYANYGLGTNTTADASTGGTLLSAPTAPFAVDALGTTIADSAMGEAVAWQIESVDGGVALRALDKPGPNNYLNVVPNDGATASLALGGQQALTIQPAGSHLTRIRATVSGAEYTITIVADSGNNGLGFRGTSGATNNAALTVFERRWQFEPWPVSQVTQLNDSTIVSGESYVFASPGWYGFKPYALHTVDGAVNAQGTVQSSYISRAGTDTLPISQWTLNKTAGGWTLQSLADPAKYLNISATAASLGNAPQDFQLIFSGDTVRITRDINGTVYNLRLTAAKGGGWEVSTTTGSSTLKLWKAPAFDPEAEPDEPTEREDPLYTVAAFSDMHVEYDFQHLDDPIRQKNREVVQRVKDEEQPDAVLVPGDTIGDHNQDDWTRAEYDNVTANVQELFDGVTPDDNVMYINGNHDHEPGEFGTTIQWDSGAWIDQANRAGAGDFDDVLYSGYTSGAPGDRKLLAFYYRKSGVNFIGISSPFKQTRFNEDQLDWLEEKLATFDPEDVTILFQHYPLVDNRGGTPGYTMDNTAEMGQRYKQILLKYPNLFDVYGHDHGGPFVEADTFERVTAYNQDGTWSEDRNVRGTGPTASFAGSLSYYNNRFNPGWLSAEQPKVVQVLMMYVYPDRVDLEMKNYGEEHGSRQYLKSYSVPLLRTIDSEVYDVDLGTSTVSGVAHGTTVSDFVTGFEDPAEIVVRDFTGAVADGARLVRTGFTIARHNDERSSAVLEIAVDRAAAPLEGPRPSLPGIATSAETEAVAITDQGNNEIRVIDAHATDWNAAEATLWRWKPTAANGFGSSLERFRMVSEAKVRWSDFYGGYVVLATSSGKFVGIIDYATGERLFEPTVDVESNPHSAEVLPDGNLVTASSGGRITIYAASQGGLDGYHRQYTAPGAHGVQWDPERKVIWAVTDCTVQGYEVIGTVQAPRLKQRTDLEYGLPNVGEGREACAWGHDLYPVFGDSDKYWVTSVYDVLQFDAATGTFTEDFATADEIDRPDAKAIGTQPYSGDVVLTNMKEEWSGASDSWNTDTVDVFRKAADGYEAEEREITGARFYKARVWFPEYTYPVVEPEPGPDTTAPVLAGIADASVEQGAAFDALAGVSASDDVDGDVTSAVEVSGTVDASTPGTYEVTYGVSDAAGNTATASRVVTVTARVLDPTTTRASAVQGTFGQSVELTASVAPAGDVSGTVKFVHDDALLCNAVLVAGEATCSVDTGQSVDALLTAGSYAAVAEYSGDSIHSPSRRAFVLTLKEAAPEQASTTIKAAGFRVVYGASSQVKVQVAGGPSGATGSVSARFDAATVATAQVVNGGATLMLNPRSLAPGSRTLTIAYSGDGTHASSRASVKVDVAKAGSRASIKVEPNRLTVRKTKATVTVTINGANRVRPTGEVRVAVTGRKARTVSIKNGKIVLKLGRYAEAGRKRARVSYAGSAYLTPTTTSVSFKVRKR